ncbi:MAG: sigma-70 family RNA polymerase sigma factor [Limnochordaceae bacterium]|nr:sigma-70 family RNA polymerase sigma factor [Limnochordaceae bacterium]
MKTRVEAPKAVPPQEAREDRALSSPDGALLGRIAAGDQQAFAVLYDRYAPAVLGVARRLLREREQQEEVLQETFLTVWRKAATYDGRRGRLSSWLLAIAHHKAIDLLRRERHGRPVPLQGEPRQADGRATGDGARDPDRAGPGDQGSDPTAQAAQGLEARSQIEQALALLTLEQRQVVWLAYFAGLTHREIAARYGIPLGTVKSRLRSAVERLRDVLQAEGAGGWDRV